MSADLSEPMPKETGPVTPVVVPKAESDVDVDIGDLAPLDADRAADGTRSKLTAAPPPIPTRARRGTTLPPPTPERAARGSVSPRVALVEPKATPEMMASWQINPAAPLAASETLPPVRSKPATVPPPIPTLTAKAAEPVKLPTTIELVRAPERAVIPPTDDWSLPPVEVTGNAPAVTASATELPALPVVQQEVIPSPRESRVAPLPTSQVGADVADLPQWPQIGTAPGSTTAPTLGDALAARRASAGKLPAPRGRGATVPPPIPADAPVAAAPAAVSAPVPAAPVKAPSARMSAVLVAPEVAPPQKVSALDGSDGWVFEEDYEEREVDGEVVPTTYFDRVEMPERQPRKFLLAVGGAAAAIAVIVAIALHGAKEPAKAKTAAATAAAPEAPVAAPAPTAAPATARIAEAPVAAPAPAAVPTAAPAAVAAAAPAEAPAAAPVAAKPGLTTLPITSWPNGAVVTLVDNGNATVLGRTPVSAALDPSHSYDVVFAIVGRPTTVKHVDLAKMQELAVDLDSEPGTAPAKADKVADKPVAAKPADKAIVASAPAHHHHEEVAVAAPHVAARSKPKQLALATPDFDTEAAPAPSGGNGMLMVSAKPPCEILIDGKSTGLATPQRAISLPPGAHSITLVNSQNGIKKTIAVKVEAKKSTKLIKDFTRS